MSGIEAKNLTRKFGFLTAVDHLSFRVRKGEVLGLLGPNGAGKTTTVRMLACLVSPSDGSARVGGYDIVKEPLEVRQIVGILTENPCLYERLTAYENMDFFAEAYGLSDAQEKKNRIKGLLELFGLWERKDEKVVTFSKGMKQKLAIARALVHKPPILFLDEPTASLDPESSKEIRDLIGKLSHREKRTILLCTHRLEDAEKLCDRVMIINKGKSIIIGSPEELCDKVSHKPVLEVTLKKVTQKIIEAVRELKQVLEVNVDTLGHKLIISLKKAESATPEVVRSIVYADGQVLSVNVLHPSLEDAYLKLVEEDSR